MPLIETKWTSGKSSFKAIAWLGGSVIASKCYNIYLLNEHYGKLASSEDEWYEILNRVLIMISIILPIWQGEELMISLYCQMLKPLKKIFKNLRIYLFY